MVAHVECHHDFDAHLRDFVRCAYQNFIWINLPVADFVGVGGIGDNLVASGRGSRARVPGPRATGHCGGNHDVACVG